ncbi:SDR family oxidoreductase [Siminovitchia sp. 179-K 8D1 HS]|uniref:SDR family oxidoreductase n=1 Tax=Siminovitchia sp. 179-K 8D1 HS TaxID=3142385 RepID=UPI0039A3467F
MEKQTAFITGSASGFGLLTAVELAKRGFQVIASMRSLEKAGELNRLCRHHQVEDRVKIVRLDVTCPEAIHFLLGEIPPVDILINNAGFAMGGFCEEVSVEEYKEQFETNFFGLIAVTQAFLPAMRKQKKGKIINISSISGKVGFPGISPYVASKHALEGWSECLRLEAKPFGIDVLLVEPGSFKTSIWSTGKRIARKSMPDSSPYSFYMKSILRELEKGEAKHEDPQIVASLIADLCMRKEAGRLRYPVGRGVKTALFLKNAIPWKTWENIFLKKLLGK